MNRAEIRCGIGVVWLRDVWAAGGTAVDWDCVVGGKTVGSGQPVGQQWTGAVLWGERLSAVRVRIAMKKETTNTSNRRASSGETVDLRKVGKFSYRCVCAGNRFCI